MTIEPGCNSGTAASMPTEKDKTPLLLTVSEVATMLAISVRSTYRLIESGDLPVVRLRVDIRIDPSDVRALIEAKKNRGSSRPD